MTKIPLTKPYINQTVRDKVLEVLDSGFLTEGETTRALEKSIQSYLGAGLVLAVSNCTVGLEIALRAIGIGPGDEVIVPDFTYPATASAVLFTGAEVVLVDIDRDTMLIDMQALEVAITSRTKAVIPVSLFGNPLDYRHLIRLKDKYGFHIIEDAACALGAGYRNNPVGTQADITVFSLHPRKFITTGEGGIICTSNPEWADWIDRYKHFGIDRNAANHANLFAMIGGNYKLSNIQAAIGLAQMEYVKELLTERQRLALRYYNLLAKEDLIILPQVTPGGTHSYQTFSVMVANRDGIIQNMRTKGIEVQVGTYSLHLQPAFQNHARCRHKGSLADSDYAFRHCLALPLFPGMTHEQQDRVVTTLCHEVARETQ